jgi:hypothetical protein
MTVNEQIIERYAFCMDLICYIIEGLELAVRWLINLSTIAWLFKRLIMFLLMLIPVPFHCILTCPETTDTIKQGDEIWHSNSTPNRYNTSIKPWYKGSKPNPR